MNPKEQVIEIVKNRESPNLGDMYRNAAEGNLIVQFLISILTGQETKILTEDGNKTTDFAGMSGVIFLTVMQSSQGEWSGSGELARSLNALLVAIRVHEVDSYDWVYLPPEIRQALVSTKAQDIGVSAQELKRLMTIWTV